MLTITDAAAAELRQMIDTARPRPNLLLRLNAEVSGEYHLVFDQEREGDEAVEHQGETLIIMSHRVSREVENEVMDTRLAPNGKLLISVGLSS